MKHRMVDRILWWERGRRIRGAKAVSFEEYCLKAPLGAGERLPESLALESVLQLGNWLLILSSDFGRMGMVAEVGPVRFGVPVLPGQRLALEVSVLESDGGSTCFEGTGLVGQASAVLVERWRVQHCPVEGYHDPRDLRVLFEEIHQPANGAPA